MAKITILFGFLLIALGVVGYVGSGSSETETVAVGEADTGSQAAADDDGAKAGKKSVTALIPSMVGTLLALCGVLALKESMLKHAMHGAAMIGVLGAVAGLGRGAMGLGKFFSGDPSLNQRSFLFVWLMAVICMVFLALCVRSFIQTRKRREAEQVAANQL